MARETAWEKAFNEQDTVAGGSLYTEDAIFMEPNTPSIVGREAIAATFANPALAEMDLELTHQEAITSGDLGYVYGTYTMKDAGGNQVDAGKYVEIHRKVDGEWLMDRDIYNSDLPTVGAAADDLTMNQETVRTFVSIWNERTYDKLVSVLAPGARRITPQGSSDGTGPDGFQAAMEALHTAYPDLKISIESENYYSGGAILHWKATGTNTGPGDTPPTNKSIEIDGLTKFTIVDGKILEEHVAFDFMAWMQQLGQLPSVP